MNCFPFLPILYIYQAKSCQSPSFVPSIASLLSSITALLSSVATLLSSVATLLATVSALLSSIASLLSSIASLLSSISTLLSSVATLLATVSALLATVSALLSSIASLLTITSLLPIASLLTITSLLSITPLLAITALLVVTTLLMAIVLSGLAEDSFQGSEEFNFVGPAIVVLVDPGEGCVCLLLIEATRVVHAGENIVEEVGELADLKGSRAVAVINTEHFVHILLKNGVVHILTFYLINIFDPISPALDLWRLAAFYTDNQSKHQSQTLFFPFSHVIFGDSLAGADQLDHAHVLLYREEGPSDVEAQVQHRHQSRGEAQHLFESHDIAEAQEQAITGAEREQNSLVAVVEVEGGKSALELLVVLAPTGYGRVHLEPVRGDVEQDVSEKEPGIFGVEGPQEGQSDRI